MCVLFSLQTSPSLLFPSQWSPALTIRTALLSLQALLSSPNPDDPQDGVVASQYKKDKKLWEKTAKYWTEMHAVEKDKQAKVVDEKLKALIDMGFDEEKAKKAYAEAKGNVDRAVAILTA